MRTTTSWSKLPVAWSRTGSPAGIVEGPRGFLEIALAPTSATTTRRIDAATAPTRLNRKSMRDFSRRGRMLLEREPQGLVAWAFEVARGRMRATSVQNQGHRRTTESSHSIYRFGDAGRIHIESFLNQPPYLKKWFSSNKTSAPNRPRLQSHGRARARDPRSGRIMTGFAPSPFREILIASLSLPPFVGVIEGWEFPWITPKVSTGPMSESELVREQGGWVFAGSISNSILGFAFWALAAHLFTSSAVGIAGSLVNLSSLATSIGILGLDNGLVRFIARVDRPRALMRQVLIVGGGLSSVTGIVLSAVILRVSNAAAAQEFAVLVVLSVALTTSQTCFQITDGSILAARKSEYLAYRAVAYGLAQIALLFTVAAAGVVGLLAVY